jgi:hypothetical protein
MSETLQTLVDEARELRQSLLFMSMVGVENMGREGGPTAHDIDTLLYKIDGYLDRLCAALSAPAAPSAQTAETCALCDPLNPCETHCSRWSASPVRDASKAQTAETKAGEPDGLFIDGCFTRRVLNGETPPGCPAPTPSPDIAALRERAAKVDRELTDVLSDPDRWTQTHLLKARNVIRDLAAALPSTGTGEEVRLDELLRRSAARFRAMTPEQQEAELRAQRESWVRGEMGIGSDKDEADYRAALSSPAKGER